MEKRSSILAIVAGLALVTLAACNDGSPSSSCSEAAAAAGICTPTRTPTPTPVPLCPFELVVEPVAGFAGLYTAAATVASDQPFTLSVDGAPRSLEHDLYFTAVPGERVQGCRACGCSHDVTVR